MTKGTRLLTLALIPALLILNGCEMSRTDTSAAVDTVTIVCPSEAESGLRKVKSQRP